MGGRIPLESLAAIDWNGWPQSIGMAGRNQSEYALQSNKQE